MRLGRRHRVGFFCILAVAVVSLRLMHLGADTPPTLWTEGMGAFVDEGTKTLSSRNLALHGQTHWHPEDDYPGWMRGSAVTQVLFYLSFLLFGPTIEAARLVTIVWFLLLLLAYAVLFADSYPTWLGVFGILLLGFIHPLFLYSRNALFEVPLIVCLFGSLLVLKGEASSRQNVALLVVTAACLFATLGIKRSALLYFLPVLLALAPYWLADKRPRSQRPRVAIWAIVALAVTGTLVATHGIWSHRISLSPRSLIAGLFANALMESSPLILMLGLFSAALLLLTWPRSAPRPFTLALISIAVLGPALLSLFQARPLRYFMPLIPAYPLLFLACWSRRPWEEHSGIETRKWASGLAWICLLLGTAAMFHFLNRFVLGHFGFESSAFPGYQAPIELRYLIVGSVLIGSGLWMLRRRLVGRWFARYGLSVLAVLALLLNGFMDAKFLLSPTHDRRDLSADLERTVAPGESVIGNLAPLLCLGTDVPALLMLGPYNRVARITTLRPDYFLYSDNDAEMDEALEAIGKMPGVELEEAVLRGSFQATSVVLYPLAYREEETDRHRSSFIAPAE